MRSPRRKRRLQFEVMESRAVLSASLAGASLAPPTLVSLPSIPIPPPHEPLVQLGVLQGQLSGSYSAHTLTPLSVWTTYDLSGQGQVQPLGPMTVTGHLLSPGRVGGTLTLSDSQGTLTLKLTTGLTLDPLPRRLSPLPNQFAFAITGGTGAFANATGGGTAFLRLVADPIGLVPAATQTLLEQTGHFDLSLAGSYSLQPPQSQT
jgi:hypothetical protein